MTSASIAINICWTMQELSQLCSLHLTPPSPIIFLPLTPSTLLQLQLVGNVLYMNSSLVYELFMVPRGTTASPCFSSLMNIITEMGNINSLKSVPLLTALSQMLFLIDTANV